MSQFWDTTGAPEEFDFDKAKKDLKDNLDYLSNMSAEESTLYKKWKELQDPSMIAAKYNIASLYDWQWKPKDIYNKEQTLQEIDDMEPYLDIVTDADDATEWSHLRRMIHSMDWTPNPGRNIKANVIDRTSGKLLGQLSLASDITALGVRDDYIGWTREDRFEKGMLNHTSIASTIVSTQPLGFNFLGGKLIAMMCTLPELRNHWEEKYGQKLIAIETTSLYGIHSQYNGIPHYKTLGESKGKINIKPDDDVYEPWHHWLKREEPEWYDEQITQERIRNGENMGLEDGASGPVSGIKQKILAKIFRECNIKSSEYNHGYKRGVYIAMMYKNGREFLRGEIPEDELVMKKKFTEGQEYINKWWKRHAKRRYVKMLEQDRIKPEHLFYVDAIGISWEEMQKKYLDEVGR